MEIQRNAVPKSTSPVVTTILVPILGASAAPTTEATAIDNATGRIRAPVDSAPYPRTNWKYCVTRKMKPNSAKKVIVTAPLAALNRRSRKRRHVEHRVRRTTLADHECHQQRGRGREAAQRPGRTTSRRTAPR